MSIDLRCRHDRSAMELAAGMFDEGRGCDSVARSLGIPAKAVRKPGGRRRHGVALAAPR